jgi:hypothetical protein
MRGRTFVVLGIILVFLALLGSGSSLLAQQPGPEKAAEARAQAVLGTGFTYQGRLTDGGSPADGEYDFEFRLYDDPDTGAQVGDTVTVGAKTVTDGLFTVELDFGSGAFTGEARYLEIGVRPGGSNGAYTTLSPRQALTPAPYALALPGLSIRQHEISPNLIGGYARNWVTEDVWGATIGGGGEDWARNRVTDNLGTVAGGTDNQAGNDSGTLVDAESATVGGGASNTASGSYSTVSGGIYNTAAFTNATVSGGEWNQAVGSDATVGGGAGNTASGASATVAGGVDNAATGDWNPTVGGGYANTASGTDATVAGGNSNTAGGWAATVSGGYTNTVTADGATVGGGYGNVTYGHYSTIGGGQRNFSNWDWTTIGGGRNNQVYADYGTIGGGGGEDSTSANIVYDSGGTIAGGVANTAGTDDSDPHDASDATVGGGFHNHAEGSFATVGGGDYNRASGLGTTVAGGYSNTASGRDAAVPGGAGNLASGDYSFAAGYSAKAEHEGAYVWAAHGAPAGHDPTFFSSTGPEQFLIKARGGVGITTDWDATGLDPEAALHIAGGGPFVYFDMSDFHGDEVNEWVMGPSYAREGDDPEGDMVSVFEIVEWVDTGAYRDRVQRFWIEPDGLVNVPILKINGGSDLAEPFGVTGPDGIKPGMAVAIDPEHPGQLRLADRAYDRLVAGCVSGANGLEPGLVMQQEGLVGDDAVPVALSGRVYCWADASYSPIQPGDLLTTSDTPGHVMAVRDYDLAQGAIVGKAMSELEEGYGLILVLVTLQ